MRRYVRANGEGVVQATADRPELLYAIHDLKNWEVRQAAINAGIDVGQQHVGSRQGLGPAQVSRQALLDQMIQQGVKPEDIPKLARTEPVEFTKPMPIAPKRLGKGVVENPMTTPQTLHHELAHAILGGLDNFDPGAIISHRHPTSRYSAAAVQYNFGQFKGLLGPLDPTNLMNGRGDAFVDMIGGGAAANEIIDGLPRGKNPGLGGDWKMAQRFFDAMGYKREEWKLRWDASIDRAAQRLQPFVDLIKDQATRREDNLSPYFHFSENRVKHIVELAKDIDAKRRVEAGIQQTLPYEGAGFRPIDPKDQAAIARAEAASERGLRPLPGPQENLKAYKPPQNKYTFTVEGREGRGPETVEIEALDRKSAWKKLDRQGGYLAAEMTKEEVPPVGPVEARVSGSTVPLMRRPPRIEGEGPSTLDVAKDLNRRTRSQIGSLSLAKAAPEAMVGRARDLAIEEAEYQLAQKNSGKDWYKSDMAEHDKILQNELRPELKDPAKLSLFKFAEAILSVSNKVYTNVKVALPAWDYYAKNGVFNPVNPATGGSWGAAGRTAYGNAFRHLNNLIEEHGEKGAVDWLLSDHPTSELRAINPRVAGDADEMQPGAMILGEKRGPFSLNLHGREAEFTADRWVSRTWNRWMGTIEWDPETGTMLTDAPRNNTERALMKQSFSEAAEQLGLSTSELQAVLWYYEQRLYETMGAPKESGSFGAAARRLADEATRRASAPSRSPVRTSSAPQQLRRGVSSRRASSRP